MTLPHGTQPESGRIASTSKSAGRGTSYKLKAALAVTGAVLLLVAGIWWFAGAAMEAAPAVRTVPIEHRDLRVTVAATGAVEPIGIVQVGASVPGKLVSFGKPAADSSGVISSGDISSGRAAEIDVGSKVRKGDILFQLDNANYEIGLQKAQAAVRLAAAEVQRSTARSQQASRNLQRAERLRATNAESEFDGIATAQQLAAAELAISQAKLEHAQAEVKHAQLQLQQTTVRAPVSGVVIDRRAVLGQHVSAGQHGLFLIAEDLHTMRVRASVSETDIGKLKPGQPATFTVDAHRDLPLTGHVSNIQVNARRHGNFVTYDVLISIDRPPVQLFPHMTADVEIEIVKHENAWLVPVEALTFTPEQTLIDPTSPVAAPSAPEQRVVWVSNLEGKVRAVPVQVGMETDGLAEVTGGGLHDKMPVAVGVVKKTQLARIVPSARMKR